MKRQQWFRAAGTAVLSMALVVDSGCGKKDDPTPTAAGGAAGIANAAASAATMVDGKDIAAKPDAYAGKAVSSELRFTGDTGDPVPTDAGSPVAQNGGWTQWAPPGTREQVGTRDRSLDYEIMLLTPTTALRDQWREVQKNSADQWSTYVVTYTVGKPQGVKMDHLTGTLVGVKLK